MEVYNLKINIFEANPALPSFVERFINCYGGRPIFEHEMAFFFYAERNRRMKRGEDKERACKMAEDMVNDLVLFLAKENFIWDSSIQVIERYPDATVIALEFIEFWGGLHKLREELKPFFNIELERRLNVFHEKPSTAKFMAGYVVNWMAIRLARENGFLEIKKVESPKDAFPSLKKEESVDHVPVPTIPNRSQVATSDTSGTHGTEMVVRSKWSCGFGVGNYGHGGQLMPIDVLPFVRDASVRLNIKGILTLNDARMTSLCSHDYVRATLSVRLLVTKADTMKPQAAIRAYTKDTPYDSIGDIVTSGHLVPFNSKLVQQHDGQSQPMNWTLNYLEHLPARKDAVSLNLGQISQITILNKPPRFRDATVNQPSTAVTNRTDYNFYLGIGRNNIASSYNSGQTNTIKVDAIISEQVAADAKTNPLNTVTVLAKSEQETAKKKEKKVRFDIDDPLMPEKAKHRHATSTKHKKSSKLGRLRKMLRRLCFCARSENDDDD